MSIPRISELHFQPPMEFGEGQLYLLRGTPREGVATEVEITVWDDEDYPWKVEAT